MTPHTYIAAGESTSPKFGMAFAAGCRGRWQESGPLRSGPVAMFGSPKLWPLLTRARKLQREWFYGDHAYFGRHTHYRITRNNFQHDGTGEASPERFERFGLEIKPWRSSGSHIVLCPNSRAYFPLFGLDAEAWIASVTEELRKHTDREIRLRWKSDVPERPLAEDLADAWATVVFSSNAAVEGLLAGVPTFVLAPFAAAARLGLSDLSRIESPLYPDGREQFAWNLAANQWTLEEIREGRAWRDLTAGVER